MKKRYSKYQKPFSIFLDIIILNIVIYFINDKQHLNSFFLIYISIFWFISSYFIGYYKTDRNIKLHQLLKLLISQSVIFTLGYFTFFGFFKEGEIIDNKSNTLIVSLFVLWFVKILIFYVIKFYRLKGNNYRKVVILGGDSSTIKIKEVLKKDKELGYMYLGFFSDKEKKSKEYLGSINMGLDFILKNEVDEIFCSLKELNKNEINRIKKFANRNNRALKLIPNSREIYTKDLHTEFYGNSLAILNVKKLPLEISENKVIKRAFDILFSLCLIIFLFSWLFPLIIILIRLESKGSTIFKQKREGINGGEFTCFKFRSMYTTNKISKGHTVKNDCRITKVGAFLRKTSLDELPQFINVLLGQMSVIGPRPHMNIHSLKFDKEVTNYMKRKSVRPGITGLAQVSGYRGEIKKKSDIQNRVRLDVFYIQNWSFMLDLKIILQTFLNVVKGDEKAY